MNHEHDIDALMDADVFGEGWVISEEFFGDTVTPEDYVEEEE